jgi:hypothetical protein
MSVLPRHEEAVSSVEKFTQYTLNPSADQDKTIAFELALGYNLNNMDKLIANIKKILRNFLLNLKEIKDMANCMK